MFLPNDKPFFLFRYKHGCQAVSGMRVQDQTLIFHNSVYPQGEYLPYIETVTGIHSTIFSYRLHYCYYTPVTE